MDEVIVSDNAVYVQHGLEHALCDILALLDAVMTAADKMSPGTDQDDPADLIHRLARMAKERLDSLADAVGRLEGDCPRG